MTDINKLKEKAADNRKVNAEFFRKMKKKVPKDLDERVKELHDEAFSHIDCLTCANCCKSISPVITDRDIQRISSHLKMRPADFNTRYLRIDEEGDYVFRETPCPFLMPDNYCMIYDVRPKACREYPHTDRRRFHQILNLTLKNTTVCPAAFEVTEGLRKLY